MQTYLTPNTLWPTVWNAPVALKALRTESSLRTRPRTTPRASKAILFLVAVNALLLSSAMQAQSPVPAINQPLKPATTSPGAPAFVLTVNGTGFVQGSVVQWNGAGRQTHFVSSDRLTARIPPVDVAQAGTASVSVASPSPGGGISNVVFFPIHQPEQAVSLMSSDMDSLGANISVCPADFNGDGIVDLASTDVANGMVRVFLGNGNGTFVSFSNAPVPMAHGLAGGDFNRDGILDLVVAPLTQGHVSILLGNGDGTFSVGGTFATRTGGPYYVTVGDFNADGKLDVVTANGPRRVFTLLHDARPMLLNFGERGGFDIAPWADRVRLIDAEYRGVWALPAIGAVVAPSAVLIRPDGYVAWVGELTQPGLVDALTTWFGPAAAA